MFINEINKFKDLLKYGNVTLEYYVSEKKCLKRKIKFLYDTYLYRAKILLYNEIITSQEYNNYITRLDYSKDYYFYLLSTF